MGAKGGSWMVVKIGLYLSHNTYEIGYFPG